LTDSKNAADYYRAAFDAMSAKSQMTPAQKEVFDYYDTATLDETAEVVVQRFAPALQLMRHGAALPCDWGLRDELKTKLPIPGVLPDYSQARFLNRAASLQIRFDFKRGAVPEAIDGFLAVLTLARHIGADGTMPGKLSGVGIENEALRFFATHLADIKDPAILRGIPKRLDDLPRPTSMAEVIKSENEWKLAWLRNEGEKTLGQEGFDINQLAKFMDEAVTIAGLPDDQLDSAAAALQEKLKANRMYPFMVLDPSKFRRIENIVMALRELFRAAIVISADGFEQIKRFKDPFGTGPFVFRQLPKGFQLESQLKDASGQKVTITVGESQNDG
jgi:hypothetical protein